MGTPALEVTRLINNARSSLPGAVDALIQLEMFNVLDDFFQASNIWQNSIPVSVAVGQTSYDLSPTDSGVIISLLSLLNSDKIPVAATMQTPETLILNIIPSVATTVTALVSLTCVDPVDSNGYPQLPDWLLRKYGVGILDGVLARMMAQPAKPYSNPQLAIFHMRQFRAAVSRARTDARHANLYDGQLWSFPGFARGRQR